MGCGASSQSNPPPVKPYEKTFSTYEAWQKRNAEEKLAKAMEREDSMVAIKVLYEKLDIDGDGKITAEEWSAGLESNSELMAQYFGDTTKESNMATFQRVDVDGNGSLSWEEFVEGVEKLRNALTAAF